MTTHGYHKRACGVVLLKHVKNPIKLAREMLVRGQTDATGGHNAGESGDPGGSGGAQGHVCLGGETAENLAREWGLEVVDEKYFWTRKRWDEHLRGLHPVAEIEGENDWYEDFRSAIKAELLGSGFRGLTVNELCASLRASGAFEVIPPGVIARMVERVPSSWDRKDRHKLMLMCELSDGHSPFFCVCAHNTNHNSPDYGRDRWCFRPERENRTT